MEITDKEKRTVISVFGELLKKPYSELNTFLGSLTIEEMQDLYQKIKYDDYCKQNGLSDWKEMSAEDYEAYEEDMNNSFLKIYNE